MNSLRDIVNILGTTAPLSTGIVCISFLLTTETACIF